MKINLVKESKIPGLFGAKAITLYPFVFFTDKVPAMDLEYHELVHLMQINQLGVFKFYCSYVLEYFKGRFSGLSHYEAYLNISFEKEAFAFQENFLTMPLEQQQEVLNIYRTTLNV